MQNCSLCEHASTANVYTALRVSRSGFHQLHIIIDSNWASVRLGLNINVNYNFHIDFA